MIKKLEIQGAKYPIKFGYGAFRILGEKWKLPGVQSIGKRFQELFPEEGAEDITFEQGDALGDLALAGMENAKVDELPDRDEVVNELMFVNPDLIQVLVTEFSGSFSPPEKGNPKPRKRAGKKK